MCENSLAEPQKEILSSQVIRYTANEFTVLDVLEKYLCIQLILCECVPYKFVKYGSAVHSIACCTVLSPLPHTSLLFCRIRSDRFSDPHIESIIGWCGRPLSRDKKLWLCCCHGNCIRKTACDGAEQMKFRAIHFLVLIAFTSVLMQFFMPFLNEWVQHA